MPTTTYTNTTFAVAAIGARTDSSGVAVADYTAEETRLLATILSEGYVSPASAFLVDAQTVPNMTVKVGSGTAKTDIYVVAGETAGQGNYLVRLDASSVNVTVPAADASQARTDEVYLVVRDNTYDASSRGLPQIGYRKGDAGGSAPGPDASWEASVLLATITVGAAVSTITSGNITDERSASTLTSSLINTESLVTEAIVNAKGDLIAGTAADTVSRLAVGSDGKILKADSSQSTGLAWVGGAVLIAQEVLASDTTSVTFSSIPQTYKHLLFLVLASRDGSVLAEIDARFNGDTAANYASQTHDVDGTTTAAFREAAATFIPAGVVGWNWSAGEFLIPNYAGNAHKLTLARSAYPEASATDLHLWSAAGVWRNTGAITSVTFLLSTGGLLEAGSVFSLYGWG